MANETKLMEYMWETYLKNDKGTYLDIGANDGIYHSTTSIMSDNGWECYNVEANIYSYEKLIINRPNTNEYNFNIAISDKNSELDFYFYKSDSDEFRVGSATVEREIVNDLKQHNWISHKVECMSYRKFIKDNNITKLDFLNIDIEGHEMTVLKDMEKCDVLPRVICIEVVVIDKLKLDTLLLSLGYVRDKIDISEGDWIYVRK